MHDPNSTSIETLKLEWLDANPARRSRIENQLITENIHLVRKLVTKAARDLGSQLEFSDLEQAGSIGIIRAFRAFTPGKARFSTYAMFWVRKEVRTAFSNSDVMKKPRMFERPKQVANEQRRILAETGREATAEELTALRIEFMERRAEKLRKPVLDAATGSRLTKTQRRQATIADAQIEDWAKSDGVASLDAPYLLGAKPVSDYCDPVQTLHGIVPSRATDTEKSVYGAELVRLLLDGIDLLEPRQRDGLYMHLYENKTDKQIATALEIECATVRRERVDSIAFLKRKLAR